MKKLGLGFLLMLGMLFTAGDVSAQMSNDSMSGGKMMNGNPMVGGAAMFKNKNIVENAVNSKDHTTLVAAVKAAGLVETLQGKGPFTVFAPTNSAFDMLPAGTVDTVLKPENKDMLTKVLTYHVVAGNMDSKKLMKAIKKGNGKATLTTVSGDTLTASMSGSSIMLMDEKGGTATVSIANVKQSNGVIHVIDRVLMPN
ncbi:MAG TPA: fasciclin domain-containing protein [Pyrinomonadaceae bacterium]|nr:fasciclin domain-containing protein [Pyrinomonadaceae bacterium]